jgi:hypothetical protein
MGDRGSSPSQVFAEGIEIANEPQRADRPWRRGQFLNRYGYVDKKWLEDGEPPVDFFV